MGRDPVLRAGGVMLKDLPPGDPSYFSRVFSDRSNRDQGFREEFVRWEHAIDANFQSLVYIAPLLRDCLLIHTVANQAEWPVHTPWRYWVGSKLFLLDGCIAFSTLTADEAAPFLPAICMNLLQWGDDLPYAQWWETIFLPNDNCVTENLSAAGSFEDLDSKVQLRPEQLIALLTTGQRACIAWFVEKHFGLTHFDKKFTPESRAAYELLVAFWKS